MTRLGGWVVLLSSVVLMACPGTGIVCRAGTARCGNGCADFSSDSRNCGACGQPCLGSQVCVSGACLCRSGSTLCDGQCVVIENDPKNCGACRASCGIGDGGFPQVCDNKTCRDDCTQGIACGPETCVSLQGNPRHCGACGAACPDSQSCHDGKCMWDLVAACLSTGQVVGLQSGTEVPGPRMPMGAGPISLAQYGTLLLAGDTISSRLLQARLPGLEQLSDFNTTGRGVNQVLVDAPFVYSVNSIGHTVQVLRPVDDAGCPAVDAGCAVVPLGDGGVATPRPTDGGACFFPSVTDGGCADTLLEDGGLGPFLLADAGCFVPPAPAMPCFQDGSDAGLKLATVGEVDTGMRSFPQAAVKVGSVLWVPLFGDVGAGAAAGQKVLKIDVSNPASPAVVATVDLSGLDLQPFDGGMTVPRPYAIVEQGGKLWVPLNNLNPVTYKVEGPGMLAVIDSATSAASTVELGSAGCLNPVGIVSSGGRLYVSCAGAAVYDMNFALVATDRAGVVAYDPSTGRRATWNPQCPAGADGGCLPILPSRLAVRDGRVYLGDQNGGRIFVADILRDGGFAERRGYGAGALGPPVQACGVDVLVGFSNVADILVLP